MSVMLVINFHFFVFFVFYLIKDVYTFPKQFFKESSSTCECGKQEESVLAYKIVGGEITDYKNYPWMVAVMSNGKMSCGASLISDRYILTAGHCLNWVTKNDLTVLLKMKDKLLYEREGKGGVKLDVESITVHEDFTSDYLHDTNDVGLIKLKTPVDLTQFTPVCLPPPDFEYLNKTAVVTGWGKTSEGGSTSRLLRKANVKLLSNEECRNISSIGEHIVDSMFCAYELGVDACQGDSGGPIVYEMKNRTAQIGVVSWGIGCAKPGIPGIYARLTTFLEWLGAHTQDSTFCHNPLWSEQS